MEEIRNRVKESGIINMDLGEFKPKLAIVSIDLADQLWQGLVLKEKDFRSWIGSHDWSSYSGKAVAVFCSTDAIIPTWAFMLISSKLQEQGVEHLIGTSSALEKELIRKRIDSLNTDEFKDGRVMIKGCSDISDPEYAMTELVKKLQPHVKSLMYGEPCSSVPVFKRK
jgi:S-adenosylmethionine/arginine decarboxylase-like enzyme